MVNQPNVPPDERVLTLYDLRALKEHQVARFKNEPGSKQYHQFTSEVVTAFLANAREFINLACRANGEPELGPLEHGVPITWWKQELSPRTGPQRRLMWAVDELNAAMAWARSKGEKFAVTFDPAAEKPAQLELPAIEPQQQEQAA